MRPGLILLGLVLLLGVGTVESAFTTKARAQNVFEAAPVFAPRLLAAPTITGTTTVGDTLTANDGTWARGTPTTTRRWLRCTPTCSPIAGETDPTYLLTGNDAAATIRLEVTASNGGGSTTTTTSPTASVARAHFTESLCRNPDDGARVGDDGILPDGLTFGRNVAQFPDPGPSTRCESFGGLVLTTGGTWSVTQPDVGGWLQYRGTSEVQFVSAILYRRAVMSGNFSWAIDMSQTTAIFTSPRAELCSWGFGCTTKGVTSPVFAPENRVDVPRGSVNGFNILILCDIPAGFICNADGSQLVRLFGAKVTLRDEATPFLTEPAGGTLATASPLPATASLSLKAADAGSGLYRVRVRVGNTEVATRRLHDNGGRCTDINPANTDPFEFAHRQPCPANLISDLDFATSSWPKTGRLRVYLEDAGRNTTTIVSRAL